VLLLAMHRTPEGGATMDHRYILPAVSILGLGIAIAWRSWVATAHGVRKSVLAMCIVLYVLSAILVWGHFFAWRDG
jgi:hypothetical protein